MIYDKDLDETLIQGSNHWSRSNPFMQDSLKTIVNDSGCIAPLAATVTQRVINNVEEEPERTLELTKKTLPSPERFLPAPTKATLDKKYKTKRSCHERRNRKDRKYRDSLEESRENADKPVSHRHPSMQKEVWKLQSRGHPARAHDPS